MYFPRLPYKTRKAERQMIEFLGINLTENTKEGEMTDSYGVTTDRYPCIGQCRQKVAVEGYSDVSDVFEWNGKLVIVSGDTLYYDGRALDTVTAEKKQFAVVNNQIVVMPDKICINITDGTYRRLGQTVRTSDIADSTVFAAGSVTAPSIPIIKTVESKTYTASFDPEKIENAKIPCVYTYGTDISALEMCWNADLQRWEGLDAIEELKSATSSLITNDVIGCLKDGDIIIPKETENIFGKQTFGLISGECDIYGNGISGRDLPDKALMNCAGYYGVVSLLESDIDGDLYGLGLYKIDSSWRVDVYSVTKKSALFSAFFAVGDYVDVTGTKDGANDRKHLKISAIDDATNTVTLEGAAFTVGNDSAVTVSVEFPELDYICSSDNRLFGVSNKDNTIYASALGMPNDFYSYGGLATDSYAVAVSSDGDFTAICAYGGSVLCWKEDVLHKIVGDMPSSYYKTDYSISGVQKGSSRSLAIINETLFYKGAFGVYAFTGGVPQLISQKLGKGNFTDGSGGTHDNCYYLSVRKNGEPCLFAYDVLRGIWQKRDRQYVDAFATVDGVLYTVSDGTLYVDSAAMGEWMAEFVPFDETVHNRKGYSMLRIRMDMDEGAWFKVEIKQDRKPWQEVFSKSYSLSTTVNVPLRIGRCDRFQIRLSGRGGCTVRSMVREMFIKSEV